MDEIVERWTVAVDADLGPLQRELGRMSSLGAQFGRSLGGAFESIVVKGRNVGEVLQSLAQRLSQLAFRAAFKPLETLIGNAFQSVIGGGFGFAKGGAFHQGMPVPFASGGVVSAPTYFPMADGKTGLMGERGTEAIMPLTRGPDGRLGVQATGGQGVSVQVNITTPDVEGFRRSETQLAAMLARAVSQGRRNL
jgi:phage-related minor tail protein